VSQAYETLSNDDKRKIYDQHGEEGVKRSESGRQPASGGGGSVFDHFFNQQHHRQNREERTANLVVPLRVSLRQLYEGDSIEFEFRRKVLCLHYRNCMRACAKCSGLHRSTITRSVGPGFVQQVCCAVVGGGVVNSEQT
jgi:DnaJ-class molecular chaperone